MKIAHGEIWSVTLDPTISNEQRGTRPCVVISVDRFNSLPIRQVIIVPITSRERGFPHHIRVADNGGLTRPSWAMCEGIRAVSIQRFGRRISMADSDTIAAITQRISTWLGN